MRAVFQNIRLVMTITEFNALFLCLGNLSVRTFPSTARKLSSKKPGSFSSRAPKRLLKAFLYGVQMARVEGSPWTSQLYAHFLAKRNMRNSKLPQLAWWLPLAGSPFFDGRVTRLAEKTFSRIDFGSPSRANSLRAACHIDSSLAFKKSIVVKETNLNWQWTQWVNELKRKKSKGKRRTSWVQVS